MALYGIRGIKFEYHSDSKNSQDKINKDVFFW